MTRRFRWPIGWALCVAGVISAGTAGAQTPLWQRYESYFATPFADAPRAILLQAEGEPAARLAILRNVVDRALDLRGRDSLRIQRVAEGRMAPTGYEDVDGDGQVTAGDVSALDAFVLTRLGELGEGFSADELGLFIRRDPASTEDPAAYQALLDAVDAQDRECIVHGCDHDEDGVDDLVDLCPGLADPAQGDRDGDGIGDACDEDDDNNAVPDAWERCLAEPQGIAACFAVLELVNGLIEHFFIESEADPGSGPPWLEALGLAHMRVYALLRDGNPALAAIAADDLRRTLLELPLHGGSAAVLYAAAAAHHLGGALRDGPAGSLHSGRLCARADLDLRNNANLSVADPALAIVGDQLVVGNNAAFTGNVVVGCTATLANNAVLTGDLTYGETLQLDTNASIEGTAARTACAWCGSGALATACDGNVDIDTLAPLVEALLPESAERLGASLPPGALGADGVLALGNNAVAVIPPGLYLVRGLVVGNNASLAVSEGEGAIIVAEGLAVHNNARLGVDGAGALAIVYLGTGTVALSNNVNAALSLIAPRAELALLANNVTYAGGLDVFNLRIANNNRVDISGPAPDWQLDAICAGSQ